jgi:hypothetical protein
LLSPRVEFLEVRHLVVQVDRTHVQVRDRRLDDPAVAATCRDLLRQFLCLWTFASVEGVEPTNNEAERRLNAYTQEPRGFSRGECQQGSLYLPPAAH